MEPRPKPERALERRYNRSFETNLVAAAPRSRRSARRTRPITTTTTPAEGRAHQAAKRYIYAWGDGHAEGDATMRDLLGGKGAGLAEMTNAGLPVRPASRSRQRPATTTSPPASSSPTDSGTTSS